MKKALVIGLVVISLLAVNLNSAKGEKETVYGVYLPYSFQVENLYK